MANKEERNINLIEGGDEKLNLDFCVKSKCSWTDPLPCYCCFNPARYPKTKCWETLEDCHRLCPPYHSPPTIN